MQKISIIVPIFNVEQYLSICLDNIINQTYSNLDIILVNDGSTDGCPQICDSYAKIDPRIKVIHKENGGLSDARNEGFKQATGDYIAFIDSDDIISTEMFKLMFETAIEQKADIVECDFVKFENEDEINIQILKPVDSINEIFNAESALFQLMKGHLKQMVWNKLYKMEVTAGLLFEKGRINEDEFWTYKILGNAKKIVKIPDILYFYRQQPRSIMGKGFNIRRLDGLDALEERVRYMADHYPNLLNLSLKTFCFGSLYQYQQIVKNSKIDPQKIYRNKILKKIKDQNLYLFYKNWNFREVFWIRFFLIFPEFTCKLRIILKIGI